MNLARRIKLAVRAFWEGARHRIGVERLRTTYRDHYLDYSQATRQVLQEKARYFYNNSPILSRACDIFEQYTVGVGLSVHPDSEDRDWNRANRIEFAEWCRNPDLASNQDFACLQGLVACRWFVDGEAFILKTRAGREPKLLLVEAHRVSTPPDLRDGEGIEIVDGVERDVETGRPTGYYISRTVDRVKTEWQRYDARDVIHIFEPTSSNQYRGVPFCATALNTLQDVEILERLEMKAAKVNSMTSRVLETASGEVSAEDMLRTGGAVTTSSSGTLEAIEERVGGETIVLREGEKFHQHDPSRPTVVTMDYWRALYEKICMAVGIPYVVVVPERTQGTVYRGAIDGAAAYFKARSAIMQQFVRDVYLWVTSERSIFVAAISDKPATWQRVKIYPPRSINVDIGRNSTAMLNELAAGATTYSDIYGPLGEHWEDKLEELASQREKARELGLVAGSSTTGDVQLQALNGAQLQSVQSVIAAVQTKQLAPDSAKRLLYLALPSADREEIDAMVDAAAAFTPEPVDETAPAAQEPIE